MRMRPRRRLDKLVRTGAQLRTLRGGSLAAAMGADFDEVETRVGEVLPDLDDAWTFPVKEQQVFMKVAYERLFAEFDTYA